MKTQTPNLRDIVLGDIRRYRVSREAFAAKMGVSVSRMYAQLDEPKKIRVDGLIAIQELTKLPYSELIQLIKSN